MRRGKGKQLVNLVVEANILMDEMYKENIELKKRNKELEESCVNFAEVEQNLHKKIADLEQNKLSKIKKGLMKIFS